MEVTTPTDICYPPPSSLIQCPTPRDEATLKLYSGGQEGFKPPQINVSDVTFHLGKIWDYHK